MKSHEIPAISPRFQLFLDPTVPSWSRLLALGTYCLGLSQTATTLTLPGAALRDIPWIQTWHWNIHRLQMIFSSEISICFPGIFQQVTFDYWRVERYFSCQPWLTRSFPASRGSPTGPRPFLGAKSQVDLPLIPVTARSDWCQGFEHLTCLQRLDLVECRFVNDEACETLGPGKGRDPGWKKQGLAPRFVVKIS